MKTAFNILPERDGAEKLNLLIEVGYYGMSLLWFSKDPVDVKGIVVHNFVNKSLAEEISAEIESLLQSNTFFTDSHTSTTICYDFKESLLVPESYHNPAAADSMLGLVFATDKNSNIRSENTSANGIYNVYAVDKGIEALFLRNFPAASIRHTSSLQLQPKEEGESMHCIFSHNSIKVVIFKGTGLQLVQYFNYNTPVDAAYNLLNCCSQFGISASVVKMSLSGMIDETSKLYDELYRYFLHIEFDVPGDDIRFQDRIKFYPSHFFSHLTSLASCVS